jgi:hypothetical protein
MMGIEMPKSPASPVHAAKPVGLAAAFSRPHGAAPIHEELCGIVHKTFGLARPMSEALAPLVGRIQTALSALAWGTTPHLLVEKANQ